MVGRSRDGSMSGTGYQPVTTDGCDPSRWWSAAGWRHKASDKTGHRSARRPRSAPSGPPQATTLSCCYGAPPVLSDLPELPDLAELSALHGALEKLREE